MAKGREMLVVELVWHSRVVPSSRKFVEVPKHLCGESSVCYIKSDFTFYVIKSTLDIGLDCAASSLFLHTRLKTLDEEASVSIDNGKALWKTWHT